MSYLFTSESVSEGHPDKIADQISDAILDAYLAGDPESRVAVETLVTTGLVILAGEVTSRATIDVQEIVRNTISKNWIHRSSFVLMPNSCGVLNSIHGQSPDISQGVSEGEGLHDEQGAGDQGLMFGYACRETPELMPMALMFSHHLVRELARISQRDF